MCTLKILNTRCVQNYEMLYFFFNDDTAASKPTLIDRALKICISGYPNSNKVRSIAIVIDVCKCSQREWAERRDIQ